MLAFLTIWSGLNTKELEVVHPFRIDVNKVELISFLPEVCITEN